MQYLIWQGLTLNKKLILYTKKSCLATKIKYLYKYIKELTKITDIDIRLNKG